MVSTLSITSKAREPGIAPLFPAGSTLGIPLAVPLPPGVYFGSRTNYYNAAVINNDGRYAGQRLNAVSEGLHLIWSTDWKLLGGAYKVHLLQPFAYVQQARTDPLPPARRGNIGQFAAGNFKFHFVDLSWPLGGDFYANAGFGVFFPTGKWSENAPINIGANFWTFEPTLAFSYFNRHWNATLHAVYDISTTNPQNQYYSGNLLTVSATLTRNVEGFIIGPVGYWQKQVTADYNGGGVRTFGGITARPPEQYAIGGTIGRQVGWVFFQVMLTQDLYARNAVQGSRVWFAATFKLY